LSHFQSFLLLPVCCFPSHASAHLLSLHLYYLHLSASRPSKKSEASNMQPSIPCTGHFLVLITVRYSKLNFTYVKGTANNPIVGVPLTLSLPTTTLKPNASHTNKPLPRPKGCPMLPRPLEQRMTPILSNYECIKLSYLFFVIPDLNCEREENRCLGETQRFSVIQMTHDYHK
jgi:hypothetical protein